MDTPKGHCRHGEFDLIKGCAECVKEFAEVNSPTNIAKRIKEAEEAVSGVEVPRVIVKVRYFSETTGELSAREYTYYSEEFLTVGDIVTVPVRDTTSKAKVSAVGIPEAEIESFRDKVKTILSGSKLTARIPEAKSGDDWKTIKPLEPLLGAYLADPNAWKSGEEEIRPEQEPEPIVALQAELKSGNYHGQSTGDAPPSVGSTTAPDISTDVVIPVGTLTALVKIKPETDIQVMAFYNQAVSLRQYAEARVILTNDDLKPANDDLIIIRKVKKAMEEKRKEYLKPFQDHVKETNDAYKMLMEPIEQADKITAGKMLAFDAEQKRKIREAEAIDAEKLALARREAELKGGEITVDLTPVEKPEAVPDRIRTDMGSSGQRDNWTFTVVDFALVPDEYKMLDSAKVGKLVRAGMRNIPGLDIFNRPSIAIRG